MPSVATVVIAPFADNTSAVVIISNAKMKPRIRIHIVIACALPSITSGHLVTRTNADNAAHNNPINSKVPPAKNTYKENHQKIKAATGNTHGPKNASSWHDL